MDRLPAVHQRDYGAIADIRADGPVLHHVKRDGKDAGMLAHPEKRDGISANDIIRIIKVRKQVLFRFCL